MTTRRAALAEGALQSKGFVVNNGSHREFRLYAGDQRTGVVTHVSHNSPPLDDFLLGAMARQVKLSKESFLELVDCTLSGEDYLARMVEEGHVVLKDAPPTKAPPAAKKKGNGDRRKRR